LKGFGDFEIREQVIHNVKYADDLALLAMEETVLQGMFDKLNETLLCKGIEMNLKNLR